MDEAALIRAAQAGDEQAFEQLVHSYDQAVLRLAAQRIETVHGASVSGLSAHADEPPQAR